MSSHPYDISRRLNLRRYEGRLEALFEGTLLVDGFSREARSLRMEAGANGTVVSAFTEAAINEVVSLFRAQLEESAASG